LTYPSVYLATARASDSRFARHCCACHKSDNDDDDNNNSNIIIIIIIVVVVVFLPSVSMFPRKFKNWKYKMKVGTTINLCDQRPADSHAAKWR